VRAVVTGVAGFIGSHLADRLLAAGHEVVGVDAFTSTYDLSQKRRSIEGALGRPGFRLVEADLRSAPLPPLLEGAEVVFHQAATAGVRASWGAEFDGYTANNVNATQRLLEACRGSGIRRFVYASSSSIYGESETLPTSEDALPRPISPYGVTKLAGEHLARLYWVQHRVPTVSLRYFTVVGPRQRPDMAFHRFARAMLEGRPITVYGDGEQTRDFTFVGDAVEANVLAAERGENGAVYNIGGGGRVSVRQAIADLEEILEVRARVENAPPQHGDPRHTGADVSRARDQLGYAPRTPLREALRQEAQWLKAFLGRS
jgi:UDP-glucose 4-epimerase